MRYLVDKQRQLGTCIQYAFLNGRSEKILDSTVRSLSFYTCSIDPSKKHEVPVWATQYSLAPFPGEVEEARRSPGCDHEEMARYAEDVYYETAIKVTREAAQILRGAINSLKQVDEKLGNWDLVTEYDRKIENVIIGELKQAFPGHRFIAEESTGNELPELTDVPTWIIDPIDGTTNFVHRFPHTCVVIGLAVKKEMVLGIVYNPILEELFTARKGRGAFLNGKPIHVSEIQDLSKALVCMEPGFIKIDNLREKMVERLQDIIKAAQGIRTLGVAALTLCYIALGIVEAYYVEGPGISTWDIAAASLIISEAGGVVVDRITGEPIDIMKPRAVAACNSRIARDIVNIIREADQRVDMRTN